MSGQIRVDFDADGEFARSLTALERSQLPFAAMQAINATAFEVRKSWGAEISGSLDRPTAFTRNAALVAKASKTALVADVFIRDQAAGGNAPATYLQEQVFGGPRRRKAIEGKLTALGVMPAGVFATPGSGARLNAAGNIARSQTSAVVAAFSAGGSGKLFAVKRRSGKLSPGVYQRMAGRAVKSVLRFVTGGRYGKRLELFAVARKVYERRFQLNFDQAFRRAVASAMLRGGR